MQCLPVLNVFEMPCSMQRKAETVEKWIELKFVTADRRSCVREQGFPPESASFLTGGHPEFQDRVNVGYRPKSRSLPPTINADVARIENAVQENPKESMSVACAELAILFSAIRQVYRVNR